MFELRVPTKEEIRAVGWSGDVTRFPLSPAAFAYRCRVNGITPMQIPNFAWLYAPNEWVRQDLERKAKNG